MKKSVYCHRRTERGSDAHSPPPFWDIFLRISQQYFIFYQSCTPMEFLCTPLSTAIKVFNFFIVSHTFCPIYYTLNDYLSTEEYTYI